MNLAHPDEPHHRINEIADPLAVRICRFIPETLAIYFYGSRIRGGVHPASDLDIALLPPRSANVSALRLAQLQGDLESFDGAIILKFRKHKTKKKNSEVKRLDR